MLKLDLNSVCSNKQELEQIFKNYQSKVEQIAQDINEYKVINSEMLNWIKYPNEYDVNEMKDLVSLAKKWHDNKQITNVVMLTIGGSYHGTKAAIDLIINEFHKPKKIYFVSSMSSSYVANLIEKLSGKDFYLIVTSKSGTTLETSLAFRFFYNLLVKNSGSEKAKNQTVLVTDKAKGVLRKIANKYNFKAFVVPDGIGGRYGAITPVCLFTLAVFGIDVYQIIAGAKKAIEDTTSSDLSKNTAYQYAVLRHHFYTNKDKKVEMFLVSDNAILSFCYHLKHLFGESEGKDFKGLMPFYSLLTTDLHSIGQFLQEGSQIFFETSLMFEKPLKDLTIPSFLDNEDEINYLQKFSLDQINKIATNSVIDAHHIDGKIDVIKIICEKRDAITFGYLYTWFSKACVMSGLLLQINPFNEPGVKYYKNRMFAKLKA